MAKYGKAPHRASQGLTGAILWYNGISMEDFDDYSEGGEAIARAVHGLKDIGAGTDENVDVRSEDHNGVEIKLNDDEDEKPTNFKTAKTKPRDKYDQYVEDLREEFRKLEDGNC